MRRLKNRLIARVITNSPALSRHMLRSFKPVRVDEPIPWSPPALPPSKVKVALVTTAGVHHRDQMPFDMNSPDGDPSFREIASETPIADLTITHDYYDHRDADKDINIVFPVERLNELCDYAIIGSVAKTHYSFMGHITGEKVDVLIKQTAPEVARRLRAEGVDVVILTPG